MTDNQLAPSTWQESPCTGPILVAIDILVDAVARIGLWFWWSGFDHQPNALAADMTEAIPRHHSAFARQQPCSFAALDSRIGAGS